jgi:hypothetical protein
MLRMGQQPSVVWHRGCRTAPSQVSFIKRPRSASVNGSSIASAVEGSGQLHRHARSWRCQGNGLRVRSSVQLLSMNADLPKLLIDRLIVIKRAIRCLRDAACQVGSQSVADLSPEGATCTLSLLS